MTTRPLSPSLKSDLITQVQAYQGQLGASEEASEYLAGRGLTERTIADAALGYVGVGEGDAAQGHEKFRGRICIPYLTTTGPVKLRFRSVGDSGPKYMDMPGNGPRLYNVAAIAEDTEGTTLHLCEGEFDTLIAQQAGLTAVGLPGVTSWQPHFRNVLEGYDQIIVLADNDDNGQGEEMGAHVAAQMPGTDVRTVLMPEGFDVNSAYLDGGAEALLEWVEGTF